MTNREAKPREFAVYRDFISGRTTAVAKNFDAEAECNACKCDTVHNVIEKSAYDQALARIEELEAALMAIYDEFDGEANYTKEQMKDIARQALARKEEP